MKNRLLTGAALVAALILTGCEEKAPTSAPTGSPVNKPTEAAPAPAPTEAPKPAEPAPAAETTATAQGSINLFISSMEKREFDTALTCLDPASEGYKQIEQIVGTIKTNSNIPPDAVELVKNFLSTGFVGMTGKVTQEEGDRARAELTPKTGAPLTVDINKFEGKWLIIAPQNIIQAQPVSTIGGAAGTPPPAPAPAPAGGGAPEPK